MILAATQSLRCVRLSSEKLNASWFGKGATFSRAVQSYHMLPRFSARGSLGLSPRHFPHLLESRLNLARERAEIRNPLQFIIRQFDPKMILQLGQQIESLQAVNPQRFKKIVVGT
jgi:hypothetical protein